VEFGGAIQLFNGANNFESARVLKCCAANPFAEHGLHDGGNLLGVFPLPKDDFGEALAQSAVMIDLCKTRSSKADA